MTRTHRRMNAQSDRETQSRFAAFAALLIYGFASSSLYAAGSGMPWEGPLQNILDSIQGPVVRIVAVLIIAITGLTLAFGDTSGGFRRLVQVVFGLSIAFAATSFFLTFFGYAGGATVSLEPLIA
jgi:type IV secretion system protein TrbC